MSATVVILCGGQGTRLREHTEHMPKPMVPIGNRPIVWHIMKTYAHYGYDNFVLCLGYKGERIKEYFLNYDMLNHDFCVQLGSNEPAGVRRRNGGEKWKVTLVDTGDVAMTGARLKRVAPYLEGDRFMLTYGDGVADLDVSALMRFHLEQGRMGTVTGVHPPSRFGELAIDGRRVASFSEKPQVTESYINGGYFVFERAFLDRLDDDDACVLERAPLERLAAEGDLSAFLHDGFWQCMDTHRDWLYLDQVWKRGDAPWRVWGHPSEAA